MIVQVVNSAVWKIWIVMYKNILFLRMTDNTEANCKLNYNLYVAGSVRVKNYQPRLSIYIFCLSKIQPCNIQTRIVNIENYAYNTLQFQH